MLECHEKHSQHADGEYQPRKPRLDRDLVHGDAGIGVTLASVTASCVATVAVARSAAVATTQSPFAETREGEMNCLPGVTLIVADASGGSIGGVVIFYFQKRTDDSKWHVEGGFAAPLLAVHADGADLRSSTP